MTVLPEKPVVQTENGISNKKLIHPAIRKASTAFIIIFGILLPLFTIGFEYHAHFCAETFFDPIPTIWHVLIISIVPVANILAFICLLKGKSEFLSKLGLLNGIAIGTAFFYTMIFLPLLPLSIMAITMMGMGFLSLSPILSFIATLMSRRRLKELIPAGTDSKLPGLWWGICISIGLLILFEAPTTLTRFGMEMANSVSKNTSLFGIKMLRSVGNEETMLKSCYERPGMATDIIGFLSSLGNQVHPSEARKIYYRVTGVPFNSVPPPRLSGLGRFNPADDWAFDEGIGGESVAGRVKGLSLASSRMDGAIDPNAALSYLEWTMVFNNTSMRQREARAMVLLPPGGVVSRLTLWVDGEEREAAFAARKKVKDAYQKVVRKQRDPVLVTTRGVDRVLVQCFPVPVSGEMKIRFGITAPLQLETLEEGQMFLPCFIERNFGIPDGTSHEIWIESKQPISVKDELLSEENPKAGLYAVRGSISNQALPKNRSMVLAKRSESGFKSWAPDHMGEDDRVITQLISEKETIAPGRVIFVIDGSKSTKDSIAEIAEALKRLPGTIEVGVIVASDHFIGLTDFVKPLDSNSLITISDQLRKIQFEGGCDNVPALTKAWELASKTQNSAIVWIHGVQPVILSSTAGLEQKWDRRPDNPKLYDLQITTGPNKIMDAMDDLKMIKTVHRTGTLRVDLEKLFAIWSGRKIPFAFIRENISKNTAGTLAPEIQTSSHLARLWAYDKINRLISSKKKNTTSEAMITAVNYQLVTPITGAVVLENQEQYDDAGLEPVAPGTVPTIPEPETWMLIIVVFCTFLGLIYRRRIMCKEF
jgi:hypothetical protein